MSTFNLLLDEHIQILTTRGYDEKTLNSSDMEGRLLKMLQQNLAMAIRDSFLDSEPIAFTLKTSAFLNDGKDIVHISLDYLFDPAKQSLEITSLLLDDRNTQHIKVMKSSYELPHSNQILLLLQQQKIFDQQRTARYIPVHQNKGKRS